jgi:hypothetical protein
MDGEGFLMAWPLAQIFAKGIKQEVDGTPLPLLSGGGHHHLPSPPSLPIHPRREKMEIEFPF